MEMDVESINDDYYEHNYVHIKLTLIRVSFPVHQPQAGKLPSKRVIKFEIKNNKLMYIFLC
jgi:hypothetical protein